ncbi:MAG: hypothetical protein FWC86_05715 [Coriobacteriia bacterium]|nr:hypothetical protein [Coriobacteriia bacterium]
MGNSNNFHSYRGHFFSNVGRTVLIHVLMTLLGALGIVFASLFQSFNPIAILFLLSVVGYAVFGYLILRVLPKNNFLSVFVLALLLAVISTVLIVVSTPSDTAVGLLSFVNFPAYMVTTMLIFPLEITNSAHAEYLAFLLAAFVPSPLIYLGLRLRMRQERRRTSLSQSE